MEFFTDEVIQVSSEAVGLRLIIDIFSSVDA